MEKKKILVPSLIPYYIGGLTFLAYCFIFKSYRMMDFVIAMVISIVVTLVSMKFVGKREVEVYEEKKSKDEYTNFLLEEGYRYLEELMQLKSQIEDTQMVSDIDDIIQSANAIFDHIANHPPKAREVRKFINFYFPTLINLLKNYDTLENEHQDEAILIENMNKVKNTLYLFKDAFRKQYTMLFEDKAMDISRDISVMEIKLAQDGFKDIIKEKENV